METKEVLSALAAVAQDSLLAIFRLLIQAGPVNLPLLDVPLSRSFMRLSIAVPRASFSQTALD